MLDYLADRLIVHDWSLKWLQRQVLTSAAYCQAGDWRLDPSRRERSTKIDPDNALLWKFPRRRVSAEELRDTILLLSGELDRAAGRGHAFPPEHEWKFGQHTPYIGSLKSRHRSVYLMRQRVKRHPFLATFDAADPNVTTGQRGESTTALQALWLMNNPDFHVLAEASARRLLARNDGLHGVLKSAHLQLTGHPPGEVKLQWGMDYLREAGIVQDRLPVGDSGVAAVASYLRVLMSSNMFLYVD